MHDLYTTTYAFSISFTMLNVLCVCLGCNSHQFLITFMFSENAHALLPQRLDKTSNLKDTGNHSILSYYNFRQSWYESTTAWTSKLCTLITYLHWNFLEWKNLIQPFFYLCSPQTPLSAIVSGHIFALFIVKCMLVICLSSDWFCLVLNVCNTCLW